MSVLGYCMRLVPVFMYGSETMIRKGEERSKIRVLQMDVIRSLLRIRKMDSPECTDMELWGVKKGMDERIEEDVRRWFSHVEMMENDRTAKRVYVGVVCR